MQTVTTIGLDVAKSIFQIHGVDAAGHVIVRRKLKRRYVLQGQIDVLTQRLALATEQQKAATEQAKKFEAELEQLKAKTSRDPTTSVEIKKITMDLDRALQRLMASNNAVSSTLTSTEQLKVS
jgi:hypothetical protein